MKASSIIVLRTLAAVAVAAACFCGSASTSSSSSSSSSPLLPPDTANWPLASYLWTTETTEEDRKAFEWVRESLEERKLTNAKQVKEFFKETQREMLREATRLVKHKGKYILVEILDDLIGLTKKSPIVLRDTVNQLVKLVEFVYGSLEVLQDSSPAPNHDLALYDFLRRYSKSKFYAPVDVILDRFERQIDTYRPKIQGEFDDLVGCHNVAGYQLADLSKSSSRNHREEFLRELAQRMDLYAGNFDSKCMTKVATVMAEKESLFQDHQEILQSILTLQCDGLSMRFSEILDYYNLLRLFNPYELKEVSVPAELLKLNEYSRLCHQLNGWNTRQQVAKNLRTPKKKCGLMSKVGKNLVGWCH